MNVSIKTLLHRYALTLEKQWKHDRSKTVGASEIGQCARKTWFSKHDAPRDEEFEDDWGATARGQIMEDHFWLPALRANLPEGVQLLFAGEDQRTLSAGYLSETTDGLLVWPNGYCINLDSKSIDPRIRLDSAKPQHRFQVHQQMGLIRELTEFRPETSIISYINTSFWSEISEFVIEYDPRVYSVAKARAEKIMTASDALELPPEGKMAGGRDECPYCPWQSHCANVTVAGVPREDRALDNTLAPQLMLMRDAERAARAKRDEAETAHAAAVEHIKQFMRTNNSRKYKGDGWSISYYSIKGKDSIDIQAIEASGVDLSKFRKTGKPSEGLRIT